MPIKAARAGNIENLPPSARKVAQHHDGALQDLENILRRLAFGKKCNRARRSGPIPKTAIE